MDFRGGGRERREACLSSYSFTLGDVPRADGPELVFAASSNHRTAPAASSVFYTDANERLEQLGASLHRGAGPAPLRPARGTVNPRRPPLALSAPLSSRVARKPPFHGRPFPRVGSPRSDKCSIK